MKKQLTTTIGLGILSAFLLGATPGAMAAPAGQVKQPLTVKTKLENPLAGTQWELVSPTFRGLKKTPTLTINENSLGPSVGLNSIGGGYTVQGNTIKVERMVSTMMAGSSEIMEAERALIKGVEGARSFELSRDGQRLTLRGASTLVFRRAGATRDKQNPLAWTEWELTSPTYRGLPKAPTLKISDKGVAPSVGLNLINGGYTVKGNTIKVERMISTMMAGSPEVMEAERALIRGVEGAKTFELSRDGQRLTLRGVSTLAFRRTGTTAQGFVPAETKIINVGPRLGPEMDGDKSPQYLQLEDLSDGVSWGKFTERKIEGFNFVPGYRYQLRVLVERDQRSGEKRLRLLEVFSQQWMRSATLAPNHKILEVAPTMVDCMGVAPRKCLQVREAGGEWQTFYAPIEGFTFEDGWRYRLQVAVTPVQNPPADGSSLRYQLVRVLDKLPVIR